MLDPVMHPDLGPLPTELPGDIQDRLTAALADAARLRAALMIVAERHLIPVTHFGEWAVAIPTRPLTMTGYPAAGTPEGALLGAQAEIERGAGK